MDSEYCALHRAILEASEFQAVLRAHKNFLATVLRLSLVDNVAIQEGMERVLQVSLRFVSVCRLRHQAEFLIAPVFSPAPTPAKTKKDSSGHIGGDGGIGASTSTMNRSVRTPRNSDIPSSPFGSSNSSSYSSSAAAVGGGGGGGAGWVENNAPIFVPPEEFEFIRKDFVAHVASLFQLMRKVESRGFIFRLDFNNYFSTLIAEQQQQQQHKSY